MDKEYDGSQYGIDFLNEEMQPMSDQRPTHDTLQETVYGWLRGTTIYFCSDLSNLSYADFVEHIGCDASEYRYSAKMDARDYIWYASDKENAWFVAEFRLKLDGWRIVASGSAQVSMPEGFIDSLKNQ